VQKKCKKNNPEAEECVTCMEQVRVKGKEWGKIPLVAGVRGNLSAVLICTSSMDKGVEHFFMYLLDSFTSFEDCSIHLLNY
jgi:hypothetical protein